MLRSTEQITLNIKKTHQLFKFKTMKKNYSTTALLVVLLASTLITSCEKNENSLPEENINDFIELGKGIFSRPIDIDYYSEQIEKWTGDELVTTRSNSTNSTKEIWSEIIVEDITDAKAILRESDDEDIIVYYMLDNTIVNQSTINIDLSNSSTIIIRFTNMITNEVAELYLDNDWKMITESTTRGFKDWGRGTAGCLSDAYSNHGWSSVFAFVSTAFVPQVAAGLGIACAIRNASLL
jgi:hypothetical protein